MTAALVDRPETAPHLPNETVRPRTRWPLALLFVVVVAAVVIAFTFRSTQATVIVATRPIAAGEYIDGDSVRLATVNSDTLAGQIAVTRAQVEGGLYANRAIGEGETVVVSAVYATPTNAAATAPMHRPARQLDWLIYAAASAFGGAIIVGLPAARRSRRRVVDSLLPPGAGQRVALAKVGETGMEILWLSPQPDPFGQWTVADGGLAWRLYRPDADIDELTALIHAELPDLTAIGHIDDEVLLANLQAADAVVETNADGTATIQPYSIRFTPPQLLPTRLPELDASAAGAAAVGVPVQTLVVRVLGVPCIPERPGVVRRELALTALLASRQRPVAESYIRDTLWNGRPVEQKTMWNLVGTARAALGEFSDGTAIFPAADRSQHTLALSPKVTTDLNLLRDHVAAAKDADPELAMSILREALAMVDGQPFDGAGYDWAYTEQLVTEANLLIETAARQLMELALAADDIDTARDGARRGLRGLPCNEELYRWRMRIEHQAGNLPGVKAAYNELATCLANDDDHPSEETIAVYRALTIRAN